MAAAIAESEEAILAANETDVDAVGKSMTGYENPNVCAMPWRIRMTADDVKAPIASHRGFPGSRLETWGPRAERSSVGQARVPHRSDRHCPRAVAARKRSMRWPFA